MAVAEVEPEEAQLIDGQDGTSRSAFGSRWSRFCGFTGLGLVLFCAYLAEASQLPIFADGSSQALQAWEMLHGNLLLHGWVLSDVSFYTTELPQYMLIEWVHGLNPDVVHIAAAMTYALLVVLSAVLAKGRATGREALIRVIITVGIMVAPPIGRILFSRGASTAWVMLSAPDHTGTQVPLVLLWLMLDRKRPRWWVPFGVVALLSWVEIADSTAIYEGAVPIVAVCLWRMYRRYAPGRREGEPLAGPAHDLWLAGAALASIVVSTDVLNKIHSVGGFFVNPASPRVVSVTGMDTDFWVKVHSVLVLFGADVFGISPGSEFIPAIHLVAVALVLWAVVRAARLVFTTDDLAMQVVTASFLVLLAAFIFGYRTGAREVVGLLPLGAVLAGRMLATRVLELKLAPVLAAVLAVYGFMLAVVDTQPGFPSPDQPLATWLADHNLTYGLSTNWFSSNGVTLYSRGQVKVRDASITSYGRLRRTRWNTKATWYGPLWHDATFAIMNPCVSELPARLFAKNGQPSVIYHVDGFTVLVWPQTNLLMGRPKLGTTHEPAVRYPPDSESVDVSSVAHQLMCG
jgi:hypothetical protein